MQLHTDPVSKGSRQSRSVTFRRKIDRRIEGALATEEEIAQIAKLKPKTRGDCANVPRPCPFASCRFNLYLDVRRSGTITINAPDRDLTREDASCALDIADDGPNKLETIAQAMRISRERVRQIVDETIERKPAIKAALKAYYEIVLAEDDRQSAIHLMMIDD